MSIAQALTSADKYDLVVERDEAIAELNRAREGVTFCVPCFHQAEYLSQCLASIASQTVPPYEVIVVDDGSFGVASEHTRSVTEEFGYHYLRVTNRKLPGARNAALMLTRTFAWVPLDADDWIEPTYVEKMLPLLEHADVVVPGLQEHGPTRNGTYMPGYDRPLSEVTVDLMVHGFNRTFYASMFRTEVLREAGGYNGLMVHGFEDFDLAVDLMIRGYRYVGVEEVLFHYRTRPDGMLVDAMAKQAELMDEIKRHHGLT